MAQKYIVQLIDDLTQEPIDDGLGETVKFALDGIGYTIDLTAGHADELRGALAPFVSAGRKADSVARVPKVGSGARKPKGDLKDIRDWANASGYTVSSRGRIPGEVQAAYDAAH